MQITETSTAAFVAWYPQITYSTMVSTAKPGLYGLLNKKIAFMVFLLPLYVWDF